MPEIDFNKISDIINDTLKEFPALEKEVEFKDVVLTIIRNNYDELLNIKNIQL